MEPMAGMGGRDEPEALSRRRLFGGLGGLQLGGPEPVDLPDPAWRERPWHDPAGGFRNPPGSPLPAGDRAEWRAFIRRRLLTSERAPVLPEGHVLPESMVLAQLAALGGRDGVTWLGHACYLIRLGGRTLITDPFLGNYASPIPGVGPRRFAPPGLAVDRLPPIDVVLLSHNHYDHLDRRSLAAIAARHRPTLVTALGVGRYVAGRSLKAIHEIDWYQEVTVGDLLIPGMPAIHFSKRGLRDRNASLWCGFRITSGRRTVHFAGDTAYSEIFGEIRRRHEPPDMALVPIGAYDPRPLMQGSHCTPEEAVWIGRELEAPRLAAMHWGTIRLTDEPPFEPPERFRAAARAGGYDDASALVPAIGQTIPL
jgi:L-ascorbate metabolism protein UlaG (beta-lactamase superfamily)